MGASREATAGGNSCPDSVVGIAPASVEGNGGEVVFAVTLGGGVISPND
jgi:hypothetical protein